MLPAVRWEHFTFREIFSLAKRRYQMRTDEGTLSALADDLTVSAACLWQCALLHRASPAFCAHSRIQPDRTVTIMSVDAQMPMNAAAENPGHQPLDPPIRREAMDGDDFFRLARMSIEDLRGLALAWQMRAQAGDGKTTAAIASALTSVVQRRRAIAVARIRTLAASQTWPPLRGLAAWALLRQ